MAGQPCQRSANAQTQHQHQPTTQEQAKGELWEGPTSRVCRRARCFFSAGLTKETGRGRTGEAALPEGWGGERCARATRFISGVARLVLRCSPSIVVAHTYAIVDDKKTGHQTPRSPAAYILHLRANQHKEGHGQALRRRLPPVHSVSRQPREFGSVPASWWRTERMRPKLFHMAM